jgi:hypothetical protein
VNVNQQNRLHPYYLVYVTQDGGIHVNHTEPKRLLDLARAASKDKDAPIPEAYQPFNKATKDGRNMEAWSGLLNTGIRSMIELKEEKDLDSLFSGGRTSALTNTIQGIEDFELIAFIVVQGSVGVPPASSNQAGETPALP